MAIQAAGRIEAVGLGPGLAEGTATIPWNGVARCNVRWRNVGDTGTRDVCVIYGTYDDATKTIHAKFSDIVHDAHAQAGAEVVTQIDIRCDQGDMIGVWDSAVLIGKHNPTSPYWFTEDDTQLVLEAIDVRGPGGPAGDILNVWYESV